MTRIDPKETALIGRIIVVDGALQPDATTQRIGELVNGYLLKLAHDESGWDTLYRDPGDKRLWELTYPQSSLHGGGPPSLTLISFDEAKKKYLELRG